MARAKKPVEIDPNKLNRERAGRYVTPDGRFAVEGPGANGWYIVDSERENELGLPLMAGPFATLDDARDEVAALRAGDLPRPTPNLRALHADDARRSDEGRGADNAHRDDRADRSARTEGDGATGTPGGNVARHEKRVTKDRGATPAGPAAAAATKDRAPEAAEPAEPAWLERLPTAQQRDARRLLALLDELGIDDPALVRREFEANLPEVARTLLAAEVRRRAIEIWRDPKAVAREVRSVETDLRRQLRPFVADSLDAAERHIRAAKSGDDLAAFAWLIAMRTATEVFAALDQEGREGRAVGEPGWRLVDLDGRREPTKRAIAIEASDLVEPPSG